MDIWPSFLWSVFVVILVMAVFRLICRRRQYTEVRVDGVGEGHVWCDMDVFSHPTYCSLSEEHILQGSLCECCGICITEGSERQADKTLHCKKPSLKVESEFLHHWVHGNLPLCNACTVCRGVCGTLPTLCDYRCCWCQEVVHDGCLARANRVCQFGIFQQFIIPPYSIVLKLKGLKGRRHHVVQSVRKPNFAEWHPLIVVGNRKSGNGQGAYILRLFRGILNPAQVIDLHDIPLESGLEWCHLLEDTVCKVLVCGGDGTVGWVLSALDKLKLHTNPEISILPLGTGNDLSRVLGWGKVHHGHEDVTEILNLIRSAKPVQLDRWKVGIFHFRRFGLRRPRKEYIMNNYMSIGVDALVALNFHHQRQSRPQLFGSRYLNKLWYITYGTKDVLERGCKDLQSSLQLELDGQFVELPELEGIVLLNISSWGGGIRPWELGTPDPEHKSQEMNDGKVEVMGLYSSLHVAQMQVGLAEPIRLGQASNVKITLLSKAPMQCDGEPWVQSPAVISVKLHGQVTMLQNQLTEDQEHSIMTLAPSTPAISALQSLNVAE